VTVLVVAGPSGSGKSTLGRALAERLEWAYVEGDDLHPAANVAKMATGSPLDDADREPWLAALAARIGMLESARADAVVTCSALRRMYRDRLRAGRPALRFVWLDVPADVLAARLTARREHFMPAALLGSQLAAAEPLAPDEPGLRLDAAAPVDALVSAILSVFGL
jgi:gluconokinase